METVTPKQKRKSFFWLRLFSAFIDFAFTYSLSIILRLIIWDFTYIGLDVIFITTLVGYYTISYWVFNGRTLAKSLTWLRIVETGKTSFPLKKVVLRETIFKGIFGILIPTYLIKPLFPIWMPFFTIFILFI